MSEVQRRYTCPVCQLRFVVVFDEADTLEHVAVRIDCPRDLDGPARKADGQRPACQGHLETHNLPARYRVLPAEG